MMTYWTILAGMRSAFFFPFFFMKHSIMNASFLRTKSHIPARSASLYSLPNSMSLKIVLVSSYNGLEWNRRATCVCYRCNLESSRKGLGCYLGEAVSPSFSQSSNLIVKVGLFLSLCLAMLEYLTTPYFFLATKVKGGMVSRASTKPCFRPSMKSLMSPNLYSLSSEVNTKFFLFYWLTSMNSRSSYENPKNF